MINLLPTNYRLKMHYGRLNARLVRWIIISAAVIAGLVLVMAAGWLYTDRQIKGLKSSTAASQAELKRQNLQQVQKQADEISKNVRTINQVLGREIRFSALIQAIGKVMPRKTVLSTLTLSNVIGALDLTANAKDYTSAAQIAINLSDPKNELFEKVDIISINCSLNTTDDYPCNATLKALFGKNAQSKFLNGGGGG